MSPRIPEDMQIRRFDWKCKHYLLNWEHRMFFTSPQRDTNQRNDAGLRHLRCPNMLVFGRSIAVQTYSEAFHKKQTTGVSEGDTKESPVMLFSAFEILFWLLTSWERSLRILDCWNVRWMETKWDHHMSWRWRIHEPFLQPQFQTRT